jgi:hypothetical protein
LSTAASSLQWKRVAQVVVGSGGSGLLIENLRVSFTVTKTPQANPNPCVIKIYNLNQDHEQQIKYEFTDVILNAGYAQQPRLLFRGNIKQVYRYQENNDFVTEITAGDGDADYRGAVLNTTLAKGTDDNHLLDAVLGSFSSTIKGFINIPIKQRIRGLVVSGNTRQVLHDLARDRGAAWSIQDGQLVMVTADSVLPNQAIVLNSDSGLISVPEVNDKGITLRALMNPQFKIAGVVQLDNNDIKLKVRKGSSGGSKQPKPKTPVKLDPDGLYKLTKIIHKGDTRGAGSRSWESSLICVGLSAPITSSTQAGEADQDGGEV